MYTPAFTAAGQQPGNASRCWSRMVQRVYAIPASAQTAVVYFAKNVASGHRLLSEYWYRNNI
jgi:hypothetical protein